MNLFRAFSSKESQVVNFEMKQFIEESSLSEELTEAMNYSLTAGGKRFRPLLLLATIKSFREQMKPSDYQVAAALEMIHCYSLIHDDLPAMDDDDLRRGKPTNHKVFGEATAILAGDALLTEAFHLLASVDLAAGLKVILFEKFAKAAGASGMIAGQMLDMQSEKQVISMEQLQKMHHKKTGALIELAVLAGCLLSESSKESIQKLQKFAYHLGIAFQIKDDLLDVIGDEAVIGKRIGMDKEHDKSTYVSLLGVPGARQAFTEQCELSLIALTEAKQQTEVSTIVLLEAILKELMGNL